MPPARATTLRLPEPARRAWHRALRDLPDLPYKVETDARGTLLLSPPKPQHADAQGDIHTLLVTTAKPRGEGKVRPEYAVETSGGVKVPDVVWISAERRAAIPDGAEASPVAPEICVEVLSDSNTEAEMTEKRRLYFEAGAEEVWIVSQGGAARFYDTDGRLDASKRAPDFPQQLPS